MQYKGYIIISIIHFTSDIFIIQVQPKDAKTVTPFLPGQHVYIKNPHYSKPEETHIFSISSSPKSKHYYEFCIRIYGKWTQTLNKAKAGQQLFISHPTGNFVWSTKYHKAVFMAGGLGISPFMSMLRFMRDTHQSVHIVLLYGNKNESIVYKEELDDLQKNMQTLHVVHILSHIDYTSGWKGYRGFITKDIIVKEIPIFEKYTYFIIGPPMFIELMEDHLFDIGISEEFIKLEMIK